MNNKKIPQKSLDVEFLSSNCDDEIDLRDLVPVIWRGKWLILAITLVFAMSSLMYAISLPNIYKSEALLAPVKQKSSSGGLAALAGQFGGLASMAGIELGESSSGSTQIAIEIMKSRKFISSFIEKHSILVQLMALKNWNIENNSLIFNDELYDVKNNKWKREVELPYTSKPSRQEAYQVFIGILSVKNQKDTGTITVSIENVSPYLAQQWVVWLIQDINDVMKKRDVEEAERSMEFLTSQIQKTNVTAIRNSLFKLIEEQTKTIMLANVRDEYVFKTIDPAVVPEKKEKPNRSLIIMVGTLTGAFLGGMIVLIRYYFNKQ